MCCPKRGGLNDYSLPESEVKILVDRDPVKNSFEEWARPGHFSRTIAKGPDTITWIWNLIVNAHDFNSHTSDLEEISRKVFSAYFGQLSIFFLWLSSMYFHGACFSNYKAWLSDLTHIGPSAQIWRASGITSELQLYCTAIWALVFAALMIFAGRSQDMFSDTAIQLQSVFALWIQNTYALAPGEITLGGSCSHLIPDKVNLDFYFPCDGPRRGGTCQVSAWDHVTVLILLKGILFARSSRLIPDKSSITINGWLRDFLWAQAPSGRGYWQELIESIVWAHNKLKVVPTTQPRALSIIQGRAVGVTHYLLGGIATTWAFFLARIIALG
ncbi:Photosystem I chlorophyll a apoprotein A1 [Capsicum baccatum]|uniref:Photosystem I chlorophyll a apoprotein A1 n=1 Tax=Capsicum baccatum TaxID=33114 RepID=A0A2G2X906_CAPBA|nr:Photosystem I chlorophyll a apoprotein A1 [Capsicum baccatum]